MYNEYFGFTEAPFSLTPDPRFSYTNALYQEAFATLRYGIEARKGFIVITGEAGTGKTTLLRRLMQSFGRHVRSEEHTSELQSQSNLVCRLLLEKKNNTIASETQAIKTIPTEKITPSQPSGKHSPPSDLVPHQTPSYWTTPYSRPQMTCLPLEAI